MAYKGFSNVKKIACFILLKSFQKLPQISLQTFPNFLASFLTLHTKGEEKRHIVEKAKKKLLTMGKKIIGTDEAAEILGITKVHLMRLCKNKGLPHYKPCGGKVYFIKQELIKWITGKEETEESV